MYFEKDICHLAKADVKGAYTIKIILKASRISDWLQAGRGRQAEQRTCMGRGATSGMEPLQRQLRFSSQIQQVGY